MKTTSMKSTAKWIAGLAATAMSAWCMIHDRAPQPLPDDSNLPRATGWESRPAEVDRLLEALPDPRFCNTPAGRAVLGPTTSDIYLWKAAIAVTGKTLPARDQGQLGACVAFATASAIEHLICIQIASKPANEPPTNEYRDLAPEVIYGGSRVQVGGGRIVGDGSVGAWAADFSRRWGVLPRANYDGLDLTSYRESTCRQMGRTGVPAGLLMLAKNYPVRSVSQIASASEAILALRQGYPTIVCSNRGFVLERDAQGFCRESGRWNHAMAILGWRGGARPGFFILNSWGESVYKGPTGPGDAPKCGFWADEAVVDRMFAQGDSWAFSDAVGFPVRRLDSLDWFVQAHPEERLTKRPTVPAVTLTDPACKIDLLTSAGMRYSPRR